MCEALPIEQILCECEGFIRGSNHSVICEGKLDYLDPILQNVTINFDQKLPECDQDNLNSPASTTLFHCERGQIQKDLGKAEEYKCAEVFKLNDSIRPDIEMSTPSQSAKPGSHNGRKEEMETVVTTSNPIYTNKEYLNKSHILSTTVVRGGQSIQDLNATGTYVTYSILSERDHTIKNENLSHLSILDLIELGIMIIGCISLILYRRMRRRRASFSPNSTSNKV